jgi:SAM-dependent methyltransferase
MLRRTQRAFEDACHRIANSGQTALPPPSLRTVGGGNFYYVGTMNVRYIRHFASLDGKRILEVGCGSGRNALALTTYDVEYHGFDIFKPYIDWCRAHITVHFPNFHFLHADIRNGQYNPRGTGQSDAFHFPFDEASFDLVILTSVFTHMLEPEVTRYVSEIARVLKAGGQVYTTFFLLNEESNRLIAEGRASQNITFPLNGERVKVRDLNVPEYAVGYCEKFISDLFRQNGLAIDATRHGAWPGRPQGFDYQDVVVAHKREGPARLNR